MKVFKCTLLVAAVFALAAIITPTDVIAQGGFDGLGKGDVVIIYDGTGQGQSYKVRRPAKNNLKRYPVVGLGNSPVLQESASAGKQPMTAPDGYYVVFSMGDDIGGKQALYTANGVTYRGIWRVVKPISATDFNENGELMVPDGVLYKERLVADYLIVSRADSFADPIEE
ncbi:hypothetical protein [Flavilitoribacter nigricans]|uniref:Uncharacterized protein n=1 Tax=Flavilitoribacter nigricans (strain ATCC 23147 / DSM 23189 / NBRC 102662 / NCIMB 1420 / SS-2) TaxID=1122177 RepID=A0A2D0MXV5_FLAN2|nr:hypothetical protein [Flavilitoribacter nigricans]PHN01047.1 hypothetical protein CRP01_39280 [Flavilitoribacter nigricans DSM 23189 = NBRC 102662]